MENLEFLEKELRVLTSGIRRCTRLRGRGRTEEQNEINEITIDLFKERRKQVRKEIKRFSN